MNFQLSLNNLPESLLEGLLNHNGNVFKQKFLINSKQKNVKPAYGTMPHNVGTKPRYKALTPPSY